MRAKQGEDVKLEAWPQEAEAHVPVLSVCLKLWAFPAVAVDEGSCHSAMPSCAKIQIIPVKVPATTMT